MNNTTLNKMKKIHKYFTIENSKLLLVVGHKFNTNDINNFNEINNIKIIQINGTVFFK